MYKGKMRVVQFDGITGEILTAYPAAIIRFGCLDCGRSDYQGKFPILNYFEYRDGWSRKTIYRRADA
jgi:hypothetical protein